MDAGHEEEFDEAFFLELDAAEAAAVASRASSTRQQRDAAGVTSDRGLEQGCSTRMSSTQRACAHGTASGVNLSWKVDSIAVRDDDAVAEESAEERIGEASSPTSLECMPDTCTGILGPRSTTHLSGLLFFSQFYHAAQIAGQG